MKRMIYDECHSADRDNPECVCTNCGREMSAGDTYFEINDASGHDMLCLDCLKKMSISDLAELFGAELKKVREY